VIRSRKTAGLLMVVYVNLVGLIVFWPTADIASGSVFGIWKVLQALGAPTFFSAGLVEFTTNVLLFMPLGFLGHTFRPDWRWRSWMCVGLAGSLCIELAQWAFLPGRSFQLVDLVANTLGAVSGYLAVTWLARRL
jgi:glycopeptide antibiotics resistance protein